MTFTEATQQFNSRRRDLRANIANLDKREAVAVLFFRACQPFQSELEALMTGGIQVMKLQNQENLGYRITLVGNETAIVQLLTDRLGLAFTETSKKGPRYEWYAKRKYAVWQNCRIYATKNFRANYLSDEPE